METTRTLLNDIHTIDEQASRLASLAHTWTQLKDNVLNVQGFTEADLGYSPTGTGLQRHVNISKLLEVRTKLNEIQEGINVLLQEGLNSALSRHAHTVLGEVKYKYHVISKLIEEFEESRALSDIQHQPNLESISEEPAHEDDTEVFHMEVASPSTETCSSPEEKAMPADPLSKYVIFKKLRNTLQGELYHAKIGETGVDVALKVCRKDLIDAGLSTSGNPVMENPKQEVEVMQALGDGGHENVLQLVDSFETEDKFYMVLEYASRGEFFDIISQAGRLDDEVAKVYFKQLAKGVEFMHSRGVCHLDLSLENLLMDSEGKLKICDFGLARFIEGKPFRSDSRPGKIQYMSPEIFSCSDFQGDQSDMFSLGVILFVILCGFPPFDRPGLSDMRFSYILNGHLKVLLKRWKLSSVLSSSAVDLLSKLLCPAEKRLTISEVLSHPWLNC